MQVRSLKSPKKTITQLIRAELLIKGITTVEFLDEGQEPLTDLGFQFLNIVKNLICLIYLFSPECIRHVQQ